MYLDSLQVPLAVAFPLPFRVLFLVGLGVLGWATNLHGLQRLGIELEFYSSSNHLPLRSPPSNGHASTQSTHRPIYRIFVGYTAWCFAAWIVFRAATRSDTALVDLFRYVPAVCILGVVTALVCPYDVFHRRERDQFLSYANSNRRPLFNAIKYASSIPVIFLSAAQRIVISDLVQTHGIAATERAWHGEHPLFRLWLMSVAINSLYSFWWDLTNDWGLDLLVSSSVQSRVASPSTAAEQFTT
ncbi:EXS family-domain-containing protein [Chiua virens]|nr:EXS family-domain-containing protein [Chiua virens]